MQYPAGPDAIYQYLQTTKPVVERVATNTGNVATALTEASKTFEATYRWPFQMHGMIGLSCAVADVQGSKATVWSGSQAPFITRKRHRPAARDSRAGRPLHLP